MNSLRWCCPRVPVPDPEIGLRLGNDPGGASDVEAPRCEKLLAGFRLRGMRPEASRDRRRTPPGLACQGRVRSMLSFADGISRNGQSLAFVAEDPALWLADLRRRTATKLLTLPFKELFGRKSCHASGDAADQAGAGGRKAEPEHHSGGAAPERLSMRCWAFAAGTGSPELARGGALDGPIPECYGSMPSCSRRLGLRCRRRSQPRAVQHSGGLCQPYLAGLVGALVQ